MIVTARKRRRDRERLIGQRKVNMIVTNLPSVDHSPLQINRIFIVLFKPILDPAA
jgi:hypothetical protein